MPLAPGNLVATPITSTRIDLSWVDRSDNETGFIIQRKTGIDGTYQDIYTAAANAVGYTNTGLTLSTTYYYRVRAIGANGKSTFSNEAYATTLASEPPADVTGFVVAEYQNWNTLVPQWDDQSANVPGGYIRIEYSTNNVNWNFHANSYQLDGAFPWDNINLPVPAPGSTYYYRVKAVKADSTMSLNWATYSYAVENYVTPTEDHFKGVGSDSNYVYFDVLNPGTPPSEADQIHIYESSLAAYPVYTEIAGSPFTTTTTNIAFYVGSPDTIHHFRAVFGSSSGYVPRPWGQYNIDLSTNV